MLLGVGSVEHGARPCDDQAGHPVALAALHASASLIVRSAPIAWQYIYFYGGCEFAKEPTPINLDSMIVEVVQRPVVPRVDEA